MVADIGSGTGIFTRLLLDGGATVFAVEPNDEMRGRAEQEFGSQTGFRSIAGAAERTTLANAAVDMVVAAQAFHWFDAAAARTEFRRILRPTGKVVLVWNDRLIDATPFTRNYEALLKQHGTDYELVTHARLSNSDMDAFFGTGAWKLAELQNEQVLDREGLSGRLRSSSYVPAAGSSGHEPMMHDLDRLFDEHAEAGVVRFPYATRLYIGGPR
jgi:SAM-dependent methyltransferase